MSSEVSPKLDNPLELRVFSDERTIKSRKLEVSPAWEMETYYIESEKASDSPNTAR